MKIKKTNQISLIGTNQRRKRNKIEYKSRKSGSWPRCLFYKDHRSENHNDWGKYPPERISKYILSNKRKIVSNDRILARRKKHKNTERDEKSPSNNILKLESHHRSVRRSFFASHIQII